MSDAPAQSVDTALLLPPWAFDRIDGQSPRKDGFGYVSDSEGRDILHVGEHTLSEAQNVAIGNLSAAAPDMLAALKDLLRMCEAVGEFKNGVEHNGVDEGEVVAAGYMDAARSAIAKATGGKP